MTEKNAYARMRDIMLASVSNTMQNVRALDTLELVMPSFIGRRYRLGNFYQSGGPNKSYHELYAELIPDMDMPKEEITTKAANALHADVTKLFGFLASKQERQEDGNDVLHPPVRDLGYNGMIKYSMKINRLPGLGGAKLILEFSGIPAGSKCEVIKTVTGTRMVEEFEYTLKCT
jgi:hypothetical protein